MNNDYYKTNVNIITTCTNRLVEQTLKNFKLYLVEKEKAEHWENEYKKLKIKFDLLKLEAETEKNISQN